VEEVDDDELVELVDGVLAGVLVGVDDGVEELPPSPEPDVDVDAAADELPLSDDDDVEPDGVVLDEPPRLSVL
jgi:hypothetical protein